MAEAPAPPGHAARWNARYAGALQALGGDAADPLAAADALWLARVLPDAPQAPATAPSPRPPDPPDPPAPVRKTPRGAPPEPPPPAPADALPPADAHALFVPQPGADGQPRLAARRVAVPAADALPGRAAIERALKPFARRRPSRQRRTIDPVATAEASARASAELLAAGAAQQAIVPVLRPLAERWFDVALLVEQDEGMQVFEPALAELQRLLARHGGFGSVRLWRWSVQDGRVAVRTAAGAPCGPHAMLRGPRPQLVLLCTHGAAPHWGREPLRGFVRGLGQRATLAIVQLLPTGAWPFTALGDAGERVRAPERGATNGRLQRRDPWTERYQQDRQAAAVPVLPLQPPALAAWARWLMAPRLLSHAAVALDLATSPPPTSTAEPAAAPTPRDRVLRFRAIASEQAYALLRLLAPGWISLPLMRLLLQGLPGPRTVTPLAEVLLSGLLRRVPLPEASDPVFDFVPGVREWLLGALSREELARAEAVQAATREAVRRFVEQDSAAARHSFEALMADPAGLERLPAAARSFVEVSRRLQALRSAAGAALPDSAGRLQNFPPPAEALVQRPALEDALAQRILAIPEGSGVLLLARPLAGGRTLLASVLRRPALRSRFSGGIWFGADPPPRQPQDAAGPRLAVRFGPKARGAEMRVELRWLEDGPVDIGLLDAAESDAHLRAMGVPEEAFETLRSVHGGMPALVPLAGVAHAMGMMPWPELARTAPDERFTQLAGQLMRSLSAAERAGLLDLAVRRAGFPAEAAPGAALARRLGWLCRGHGTADTLELHAARCILGLDPRETQRAHGRVLERLMAAEAGPAWTAYAQQHLVAHAEAAAGAEAVRRMLLERTVMARLLAGGTASLWEQLAPLAREYPNLAAVRDALRARPSTGMPMVDAARRPLAPANPWTGRMGLDAAWAAGLDGRGVRVAVVGTGVDTAHPELQHLHIEGATPDGNGHGTAVASIVAGRFVGIAPLATLLCPAPLGAAGDASTGALLKTFSELLSLPEARRPDIVCLPLQTRGMSRPVQEMLQAMAEAGMLLVDAIGNEGRSGTGLPGPAHVLGIGALTQDGAMARYSNRGADLWAPGNDVQTAVPVQSGMLETALYARQSGTSFACAAVAGLAALLAQATGLRGGALRRHLLDTAGPDGHALFQPHIPPAAAGSPPAEA